MTPEEIRQYVGSLSLRIESGTEYCAKFPDDKVANKLLRELRYREVWTQRYLSSLEQLSEKFSDAIHIMSPLAYFVNILTVMFGTRSGIEDDNYVARLSEYVATNREFRSLEKKLAAFDEGHSMTPEELLKTISDFATIGYESWLDFRRQITNFK